MSITEPNSIFESISDKIDELIKRKEKNDSFAKKLIAELKSVRRSEERNFLVYRVLTQCMKNFGDLNTEMEKTIFLLAPMQACSTGVLLEQKISFGKSLAYFLNNKNENKFDSMERRFLALLSSRREHISAHLFPLLSILEEEPICWKELYRDIFRWEKEKSTQNKWAIDFYTTIKFDRKNA